jgi:hypothetical protein
MAYIPYQLVAALAALNFQSPQPGELRSIDETGWREFLPLCDKLHLTILLRQKCAGDLPAWVRSRIDQNIRDNKERFERLKVIYFEIANALQDVGAEHLVLKGFSQYPEFVQDPSLRMQGDLDLFCPPESIWIARDALVKLRYEVMQGLVHQATDHLPAMMRKTVWQWRGDWFDPELPIGVDLHFRFWNAATTRLKLQNLDQFWQRRVRRQQPFCFPALNPVDSLGYAALHVFHHLNMGGLNPYQVYELASFLDANSGNDSFWKLWRNWHDESLRRIEAVSFCLATEWFACRVSEEAREEINHLPPAVQEWFKDYRDSPLSGLLFPNKHALWLHLSLLRSPREKLLVFCDTLIPVRLPTIGAAKQWSLRNHARFIFFAISRLTYHVCTVPKTLWEGIRWWWNNVKTAG